MFVYNSFCLSSERRKRAPFKSKGLSPKSRISCDTINNVKFSKLCLDLSINRMKMSNIPTFDSEEGYDVTKQEYYSKKRCTFLCCDCFHKKIYISPVAYSAIPVYNNRHYWYTSSYNRNV